MARNLVMGLWGTLPFPALESFVFSLRNCGHDGEVCLFTWGLSDDTLAFLARHGIHTEDATPFLHAGLDVQTARYPMYAAYLAQSGGRYEHVMLTDTRDVVFQSDPFAFPLASALVFAAERVSFRACYANTYWLRLAYGSEVFAEFRDLRVSCSGTSFGRTAAMIRYVDAMCEAIGSRLDERRRAVKGIDQALHNYVIREPWLEGAFLDTQDELVATMHHVPGEAVAVRGDVMLVDGRPTPVIHQWDRDGQTAAVVGSAARFRGLLAEQ